MTHASIGVVLCRSVVLFSLAWLLGVACKAEPVTCFSDDDDLRELLPASGSGIYGALTITRCGAHCPAQFAPFCPEASVPVRVEATPKGGAPLGVGVVRGTYWLALRPGSYDVCIDRSCASVTVAPEEYVRIDGDGIASPGGWAWTLTAR